MSGTQADIVIMGGGPAGSAAAIHLQKLGFHVVLLEKDVFPRRKLCGEFLSTEVAALCHDLGVLADMEAAGAHPVRRLKLTERSGQCYEDRLPGQALSFSRWRFDQLLFRHAASTGVDAREGTAAVHVRGTLEAGFEIETQRGTVSSRMVIGAYGRRTTLDRHAGRAFLDEHSPYVGFKARFEGIRLYDCIELHTFDGGYCGLIENEEGFVNACWLTHEERLKASGGAPEGMIEHAFPENRHLERRFAGLSQAGPFTAVGQLSFRPKEVFARDVCMIGDAAGMIAPLCGDGMGMALRSAEIVTPFAASFLQGRLSADSFRREYGRRWRREFGTRMRLGRWLNAALIRPRVGRATAWIANRAPHVAREVVRATRG